MPTVNVRVNGWVSVQAANTRVTVAGQREESIQLVELTQLVDTGVDVAG